MDQKFVLSVQRQLNNPANNSTGFKITGGSIDRKQTNKNANACIAYFQIKHGLTFIDICFSPHRKHALLLVVGLVKVENVSFDTLLNLFEFLKSDKTKKIILAEWNKSLSKESSASQKAEGLYMGLFSV